MTRADRGQTARSRGNAVEDAALAYLQLHGLELLARNVSVRGGELDLVMRDADTVVFVEVRHRAHARFGGGAASIDGRKQRKLVLSATQFLADHPVLVDVACRFDVIESSGDADAPTLDWIRDAFRADDA